MLNIQEVSLKISSKVLIEDLNLSISPQEFWVILGKNGVGKTTLLKTLAGLRPVDSGKIFLKTKELSKWDILDLAKERAYLPQSIQDAFSYQVSEVVLMSRYPHQESYQYCEKDYDVVNWAMRESDIMSLRDRDVRSLSGGERQRVAIAATLAQETPLLLLDEPTNSLDLAYQMQLMATLQKLVMKGSKSIIMVVHDLNLVHFSTHVLLLKAGGEWLSGSKERLMRKTILSQYFDYPIDVIEHEGRTFYLPREK